MTKNFESQGAYDNFNGAEPIQNELMDLKKMKKSLETRVRHLEIQNTKLSQGYTYLGNSEPSRPLFNDEISITDNTPQ
jgi:hypothetical protein